MVIELKPRKTRKKRGLSIFSRIVSHCICVVSHRVVSCRVVRGAEKRNSSAQSRAEAQQQQQEGISARTREEAFSLEIAAILYLSFIIKTISPKTNPLLATRLLLSLCPFFLYDGE